MLKLPWGKRPHITLPLLLLQFAAAQICKPCHQPQHSQQSASAHARSLSRPSDHPLAASFPAAIGKPDWAFGAGTQAVTFVSRKDEDAYVEHPLSYYPSLKRLAPTPGHANKSGALYPTFGPDAAILRCFQCHSTGGLRVAENNTIEPAEPGVSCENCHGAGGDHARSPSKQNIHRPAAPDLNQLCGSCHRKPAAAGDETDFSNEWNVRHQPLYFSRSKCYLKSAGNLSCLNCHPAHGGVTKQACAGCHPSPKHTVRTAGKTCVNCHMPDVRPLEGLRFANHWIGVYRPGDALIPLRR